jgi:hypothetical protein
VWCPAGNPKNSKTVNLQGICQFIYLIWPIQVLAAGFEIRYTYSGSINRNDAYVDLIGCLIHQPPTKTWKGIAVEKEHLRLKTTLFIEPGSPWEDGYIESFNGKLRDELFNREIFATLTEVSILIEQWRRGYNQIRLHSSLGYQPSAPEAIIPVTLI